VYLEKAWINKTEQLIHKIFSIMAHEAFTTIQHRLIAPSQMRMHFPPGVAWGYCCITLSVKNENKTLDIRL
jgi:hypothetical protein